MREERQRIVHRANVPRKTIVAINARKRPESAVQWRLA